MISFSKDNSQVNEEFYIGNDSSFSFTSHSAKSELNKIPVEIIDFVPNSSMISTSDRSFTLDMRVRRVYTYESKETIICK